MKEDTTKTIRWLCIFGIIPVVWLALLIAPYINDGLSMIIKEFPNAINEPFHLSWCNDSVKTMLIFIVIYIIGISIYLSSQKNYRRREEHGSAKWGVAREVNKKYKQMPISNNKILTQNVGLGLNGKKHRRNLNVLVCGGSGAGKTRFYCKPNIMQTNTSFVVLDPKGSSSNDPFWDTAASMLLLALVFYLKYEAPEEEQNFPMVMELLRAGEVHEDDDSYLSPLDVLFNKLESKEPEHIAVKYYRDYRSGSAKTLKSTQITLASRLEKFNLESLAWKCSRTY